VLFAGDMRALARAGDVRQALTSMCLSNSKAAGVLRAHGCTACTDVTGFGLMGHLVEMCRAFSFFLTFKILNKFKILKF
jgi:selenide,water dikinase